MAEKEEEKGFVIKDRRRFTEEAEEAEAAGKQTEAGPKEEPKTEPSEEPRAGTGSENKGPFPEVTMATFIFSLSSSALVHLGEIPDPSTNKSSMDLAIAKQIIDTLGMLQDKTKGNLDPDEDKLMRSVLYDLRMRFIQKSGQ